MENRSYFTLYRGIEFPASILTNYFNGIFSFFLKADGYFEYGVQCLETDNYPGTICLFKQVKEPFRKNI